jgi:hypothetical protein
MAFAIGGIVATLYLLLGLALLFSAITVSDLALCSDPAGVSASGEDDCIDTSSAGRAAGLVLAYASTFAAFTTVGLGVLFARRRERAKQLAAAALATPVLALGAIFFLPISF